MYWISYKPKLYHLQDSWLHRKMNATKITKMLMLRYNIKSMACHTSSTDTKSTQLHINFPLQLEVWMSNEAAVVQDQCCRIWSMGGSSIQPLHLCVGILKECNIILCIFFMKKALIKCRYLTLVSFTYIIKIDKSVVTPQHELQWCFKQMTSFHYTPPHICSF